jgi:hypothetical protein
MNKRLLALTAASAFAASSLAGVAHAQAVKCAGINSCKGQSECMTAKSSCKGQNACKGQGWNETSSASECTTKGGKVF